MLELGGATRDAATDDLQAGTVHGDRFAGITDGRVRQLGGTSNLWGGQALPMDPIDFVDRDWVPDGGWPIPRATIAPYYARAAAYLGIDQGDFDHEVFARFDIRQPDWLPAADFRYHISKWAPEPRLIDLYRRRIERSGNVRVVVHATLTDIGLSPSGGHVEHVVARNLREAPSAFAPAVSSWLAVRSKRRVSSSPRRRAAAARSAMGTRWSGAI